MVEIVLGMERIMIIVEKRGINGSQLYSAQVYANFWARLYVCRYRVQPVTAGCIIFLGAWLCC